MNTAINTVPAMRDAVLFDGADRPRRLSRFWILLTLAATIASAGVVGDSTATVIGAMIIAPMMLPIQGAMLSTVLGDRRNLARSIVLILAGAAAAIAIGFIVGLLVTSDVVAATNSQVAGRVTPRLIDLLAALGTGVVGSIALARKDISDTLPGVAISISLVPPLTVAGLVLESGAYGQALGALILFATNVAAILVTGVIVMAIYGVRPVPAAEGDAVDVRRGGKRAMIVIVSLLVIVGIPLTYSSIVTGANTINASTIQSVSGRWATEKGWDLLSVDLTPDGAAVRMTGPLPVPDVDTLRSRLVDAGVTLQGVKVELVPSYTVDLGD